MQDAIRPTLGKSDERQDRNNHDDKSDEIDDRVHLKTSSQVQSHNALLTPKVPLQPSCCLVTKNIRAGRQVPNEGGFSGQSAEPTPD